MQEFTWEVRPDGEMWKVFREGVRVLHKPDRETCVEYARREAATEYEVFEHGARLVITNEDGSVDEELVGADKSAT